MARVCKRCFPHLLYFQEGHAGKWLSSEYHGGKCLVHMLVFLATILSGLTYGPVSLMFKFMNVIVGTPASFYQTQRIYSQAIHKFFRERMTTQIDSFRNQEVELLMDTRFDTPGRFLLHTTLIAPYFFSVTYMQ